MISLNNGSSNVNNHVVDWSKVTMMEPVTLASTGIHGNLIDVQHLLKLMDICTCASAEKHTGVQCVTVCMSDVVVETYPKCGDIIELVASPVYTAGRTSLDIGLDVIVFRNGRRLVVCEAIFTYVTTKGPNGEKRYSPPLCVGSHDGRLLLDESTKWKRRLAQHRRALIDTEHRSAIDVTTTKEEEEQMTYDFEITHVVLPMHQNHMGHTFGGIVMGWMAQAAICTAIKYASTTTSNAVVIRSVLRVDFHCGSDVSDHLILRPRLNAIFDAGKSAEIGVRVSKRSISTGEEIDMNIGYFYISAISSSDGSSSANEVLFGSSQMKKIPRSSSITLKSTEAATNRRRHAIARLYLLGRKGPMVEWHPSLERDAPQLTIESVLRLVHHNNQENEWDSLPSVKARYNGGGSYVLSQVEWTVGETWGRSNTFVLRVKGMINNPNGTLSLTELLDTLKSKRSQWDSSCSSIETIEAAGKKPREKEGKTNTTSISWDIVKHNAISPNVARRACNDAGVKPQDIVPLCLLRAWQIHNDTTAVFASQSVVHLGSIKEEAESDGVWGTVRPSGWFLNRHRSSSTKDSKNDVTANEGFEVTYIAEHDFVSIREIALGMSDEDIVMMMANIAAQWFQNLNDLFDKK